MNMSSTHLRIYTAGVLILIISWIMQLPTAYVAVILMGVGGVAVAELGAMCYRSCGFDQNIRSSKFGITCLISAMAACILYVVQQDWTPQVLTYLSWILLCWAIINIVTNDHMLQEVKVWRWINSSLMTTAVALSGLVFTKMHAQYHTELFTIITLTALSDSAGYVCGKLFGKIRVFKTISPNKTEFGTLAMLLIPAMVTFCLPVAFCGRYKGLLYGVGIISLVGDLWMSQLKRSARKKDTGSVLPGHGGILDRLDSHILVLATLAIF